MDEVAGGSVAEIIIYLLGEEDKIIAADRTSNYPPEAARVAVHRIRESALHRGSSFS